MKAGERGSATPFAVACLGLLVLVAGALGVVTAMVHALRRAQSAADLGALAAAQAAAVASGLQRFEVSGPRRAVEVPRTELWTPRWRD